ncbi:uncharacterized protein LOC6568594 isoform X1 [Drosophila grimshawi]|uniref:uncharacterized protein LOC6568594 isoform X1 n=1 Tax=Drosophila grimshawi TaxID=7222 RepID=UPI000C86F9A3|nr:uncharacterized protein LOC6568594 isoform X1 [Drosophila grimshawi]
MANILRLKDIIQYGSYNAREAIWSNKESVAIPLSETQLQKDDIHLLMRIRHPNIIEIYGIQHDYVLMEYSKCESLHTYLHGKEQREYTVRDVLSWMHQAAMGLQYLHSMEPNPFFRHINTKKFLLSNNFCTLKIGGILEEELEYESPLASLVKSQKAWNTQKNNVYSFGIIFWESMSRKIPLYHGLIKQAPQTVVKYITFIGIIPILNEIQIPNSEPIKELIEKCWNSDPVKSPAMEEILSQVTHFLNFDPSILDQVFSANIGKFWDFAAIKMGDEIGKGYFGVTYKATWNDTTIAVKKLTHIMNENIKHRIEELMPLSNPHIVSILGIAMDGEFANILMEYLDCPSVSDYIHDRRYEVSLDLVWYWMSHASEAINYLLCEKKLDPRFLCNLTPKNMMLGKKMQLCNFCLAFDDKDGLKENLDKSYLAPEVMNEGEYSAQSVVYTYGIIFWESLTRREPFHNYHAVSIKKEHHKGKRPPIDKIKQFAPDSLQQIILKCWHEDPKKRLELDKLHESILEIYLDIKYFKPEPLRISTIIPNTIYIGDINILKTVGESQFGIVYKADWHGWDIGLKKCKNVLNSDINSDRKEEIKHFSRMDHENIVTLYDIGYIEKIAHLVMEYSNCGSLYNYLHGEEQRSCTAINSFHWMYQAAKGIQYLLDGRPITTIHRNLNSQNMLLFDNFRVLKISDYCFPAEGDSLLNYQDNAYVAPEVFEEGKYTKESDVYSFGIVFWEVMSRKKPFSQFNRSFEFTNVEEIQNGKRPPLSDIIESEFNYIKEIIERCWDTDPKNRPTISELVEQLHEPELFENVDYADIEFREECIGRGTFGIICKANWCEKEIAVQQCTKSSEEFDSDDVGNIENVVRQLSRVHHENIVELYGITVHDNNAFILMNYPDCITLHNYLHGEEKLEYTVGRGLNWMIQCAKGLAHLHAMKPEPIFHNCLTPSNLLLTENYQILKISDFGIAHELPMAFDEVISEIYESMLNICETPKKYYYDYCSFGNILYEVMTRQIKHIADGLYLSPIFINLYGADDISEIIDSCVKAPFKAVEIRKIISVLTNILVTSESRILSQVIIPIDEDEWNELWQESLQRQNVEKVEFSKIEIVEAIGEGAYGVVYKARCPKWIMALKEFKGKPNSQSLFDAFNKEVQMLAPLDHENIVKLYATSTNFGTYYLLMEYAENKSLYDYLHGMEKRKYLMSGGMDWMNQLVNGIEYLHDYDPPIIHRDLKPQNLLLFENYKTLKIGDFGTVTEMKTKNTSNLGTESYQAPEVISSNGEYTEKCDIFSFGIILWEVMSRKKPSEYIGEGGRPELHVKIITECEQLQKLIESCWHSDPEKRPSAESIQLCTIPCSVTYID